MSLLCLSVSVFIFLFLWLYIKRKFSFPCLEMNKDENEELPCNSSVFIYLLCQGKRETTLDFSFSKKGYSEPSHFDLLFFFKRQVPFPAMLTSVCNPLFGKPKRITIGKIFTVRCSTRMKCCRVLHFSWTRKILPMPIFLLYFEVGLSAQIWFTPFKNKSGIRKAENSGYVVIVSGLPFLCLETI